jgi:hypothetical protein
VVNKVYFGVPGAIREIRAPESGMDFTSNVDTEVTELVSGGRSVYRAPTAFKTFSLSWKAHGEQLDHIVDMFNGQLDNGPYYITDPTVIGGNVLPARWANAYQLAYQANGWCKPTIISNTKPSAPDNTKYYTRSSVKLVQRTSGSSVPTQGILKTRVIRVPGKPYYLAVQGSRTGSSGIKVRGYNESTDTWDDLTTFTTFTGVPTSVVSTANTTYSMIELDVYMPLSSTLTLTGISLGSEDYRLPGNVLKNNFAINPRGGGNSTSYWNVSAGGGTGTLTAYPTTYPNRVNWSTNPQGTSATNFGSYIMGAGEAGTTTYLTSQVDGPLPEITNYARYSCTTAKTSNSTGWASNNFGQRTNYTGFAGETVTASVYFRYTGTGTLQGKFRIMPFNAGGSTVSTADSATITLTSGVWQRLTVSSTVATDFATVGWWFYQVTGQTIPAGATLDVTGVMIERGAAPTSYFDGSTAAVGTTTYGWSGTAQASTAVETLPSTGPDGRTGFIRYTQTLTSSTSATVGPYYRDTTERMGGVAGDVRYPTIWVRVNESRQVSISSSYKNTSNADVGPVSTSSTVTLQPGLWYRFDQGPMVATGAYVRFQTWVKTLTSPGVPLLGNFTFDVIYLLSDKADQDYYDGWSTEPGDKWYYWTGTAGTTESVMTDHAPFSYMPTGQGVGAIMPTGSLTGTLVSQAIDRRGLTLDFTEVQNVERTSF